MTDKVKTWELISREPVTRNGWRDLERVVFRRPDGSEADFFIKIEFPSAVVLALTKDREVIVARQFRPGPNAIAGELPGGAIDEGETPVQAAERELLEETGYRGIVRHTAVVLDCAYSTKRLHCVIITDCEKVAGQALDDGEFIEVVLMPLPEFREHLRSGMITDMEAAYLGLDLLGLL
jgi:ADP-ribose pyrophosphatase